MRHYEIGDTIYIKHYENDRNGHVYWNGFFDSIIIKDRTDKYYLDKNQTKIYFRYIIPKEQIPENKILKNSKIII